MLSSRFCVETEIFTLTGTSLSIMLRMLNIIIIMLLDISLLSTANSIAGLYTKQPLSGKLVFRPGKKIDRPDKPFKKSVYLNYIVYNLAIIFLVCVLQKKSNLLQTYNINFKTFFLKFPCVLYFIIYT